MNDDPPAGDGDAMEQRQTLVESSLPQLFETFDAGLEEGLTDPVVVLVDCEDAIGSRFARAWVGEEEVDEAIRQQRAAGVEADLTVTVAVAFDWSECQQEMPQYFPYLAETFREPPPLEGFLAVVISHGGAGTFTVPFEARSGG